MNPLDELRKAMTIVTGSIIDSNARGGVSSTKLYLMRFIE